MEAVAKPELLRQTFVLGCNYSGKILSYQKMVRQLQEAGNTTTIAHYLRLLGEAGLVAGLEKLYDEPVRSRSSLIGGQGMSIESLFAMSVADLL